MSGGETELKSHFVEECGKVAYRIQILDKIRDEYHEPDQDELEQFEGEWITWADVVNTGLNRQLPPGYVKMKKNKKNV